jgi:6-phosphogluconolactonase
MRAMLMLLASASASRIVLVGLYNTSTYAGHPAETGDYREPSVFSYSLDEVSGSLRPLGVVAAGLNVSWMARHPRTGLIYAVSEVLEYQGNTTGSIATLALDETSASLSVLGRAATHSAGPVYASVDASGRWLVAAHYTGGSLTCLPIRDDGTVGASAAAIESQGPGCSQSTIELRS